MDKLPHKISLIVALFSFIINLTINISIFEGIYRSLIVYIGVLFVFFISSLLMKWSVQIMNTDIQNNEEDKISKENSSEEEVLDQSI